MPNQSSTKPAFSRINSLAVSERSTVATSRVGLTAQDLNKSMDLQRLAGVNEDVGDDGVARFPRSISSAFFTLPIGEMPRSDADPKQNLLEAKLNDSQPQFDKVNVAISVNAGHATLGFTPLPAKVSVMIDQIAQTKAIGMFNAHAKTGIPILQNGSRINVHTQVVEKGVFDKEGVLVQGRRVGLPDINNRKTSALEVGTFINVNGEARLKQGQRQNLDGSLQRGLFETSTTQKSIVKESAGPNKVSAKQGLRAQGLEKQTTSALPKAQQAVVTKAIKELFTPSAVPILLARAEQSYLAKQAILTQTP